MDNLIKDLLSVLKEGIALAAEVDAELVAHGQEPWVLRQILDASIPIMLLAGDQLEAIHKGTKPQ